MYLVSQGEVWEISLFPQHVHIPRLSGMPNILCIRGLPRSVGQERLFHISERHNQEQRNCQELSQRSKSLLTALTFYTVLVIKDQRHFSFITLVDF